jgi:hypothetical protein
MGPNIRQGPHQVAQKSTNTGLLEFSTSLAKDASVTFFTSSELSLWAGWAGGITEGAEAVTGADWGASAFWQDMLPQVKRTKPNKK